MSRQSATQIRLRGRHVIDSPLLASRGPPFSLYEELRSYEGAVNLVTYCSGSVGGFRALQALSLNLVLCVNCTWSTAGSRSRLLAKYLVQYRSEYGSIEEFSPKQPLYVCLSPATEHPHPSWHFSIGSFHEGSPPQETTVTFCGTDVRHQSGTSFHKDKHLDLPEMSIMPVTSHLGNSDASVLPPT